MRQHARRARSTLAALVATVLLAGGCAGDADTAAFARSYDAVTEDYRTALRSAQAAGGTATGGESTLAVYEQVRAAAREAADGYRALDAPDDTAAALDDLTDNLDEQVQALDRVLAAAEDRDAAAVNAALADYAAALGAWQEARNRVEAVRDDTGPARAGP